jgi:hypothetical protein
MKYSAESADFSLKFTALMIFQKSGSKICEICELNLRDLRERLLAVRCAFAS